MHQLHLRRLVVGCLLGHDILTEAAQIVLQIIDAPVGIHLGVLLFMAERALELGACLGSRPGVNADLQPFGMDIVGQRLHVGKLFVGVEHSSLVALALPGVVDVDVDVPGILHARGHELVSGGAHALVVDLAGEIVPAVPAHWRRLGHRLLGCGGCRRDRVRNAAKTASGNKRHLRMVCILMETISAEIISPPRRFRQFEKRAPIEAGASPQPRLLIIWARI